MGPITLFDKSFLQSLNVDESVLYDNFFLTNISPLFYVETLADLDKTVRERRTPEQEVGIIASKFPEMHSSPSIYHGELCISSLLGDDFPMDGRIMKPGGRPVKSDGESGIVFEITPEEEAFSRWQEGKFLEVERKFARAWRAMLRRMSFEEVIKTIKSIGIRPESCKSIEDAKKLADRIVAGEGDKYANMKLAFMLLNVPLHLQDQIFNRWQVLGYKPLRDFAPYAAFVLTVDVFFYIAAAAKLISTERVTNKVDLAYLFYLPFCMLFISSDKLHKQCAPLFLRDNQHFVWGFDLKEDLKKLDEFYDALPQAEKEKGLSAFASQPPNDTSYLVTRLWDACLLKRQSNSTLSEPRDKAADSKIIDRFQKMAKAETLDATDVDFDMRNPDALMIKRSYRKRKGKWWQLPKDLKVDNNL